MPILTTTAPLLGLPPDTAPADADRLAALLDTHGVGRLLSAMDAVAQLTIAAPLPSSTHGHHAANGNGAVCGTLIKQSGGICDRPRPCQYHQPVAAPDGELCGAVTKTGTPCRQTTPCHYHPQAGAAVKVGRPRKPAPAPVTDDAPEMPAAPVAVAPDTAPAPTAVAVAGPPPAPAGAYPKPAACPKCEAPSAMLTAERHLGGEVELRCQRCGWRKRDE